MAPATRKQLIAQNPVNKGLDRAYVDRVMRETLHEHFPEMTSISKLIRSKFKRRVGIHNSTFIYRYTFEGMSQAHEPMSKQLIYSSHSDGSRLHAYRLLQILIAAGFNRDQYRVIVPLAYLPETKTMIYEAVVGKTLLEFMRTAKNPDTLKPMLTHSARWLAKFHSFPLSPEIRASLPRSNVLNFYWPSNEIFAFVKTYDAFQAEKLAAFFATLKEVADALAPGTPGMVYGDPHPENIIIQRLDATGLTMIDFTDVALGDQIRDIGIFVQQLKFMGRDMHSVAIVEQLAHYFVEQYFDKPFSSLSPDEIARINLYQAWNALRSFVYFVYQDKKRQQSYGLLEDAWLYLVLARERSRFMTIVHI